MNYLIALVEELERELRSIPEEFNVLDRIVNYLNAKGVPTWITGYIPENSIGEIQTDYHKFSGGALYYAVQELEYIFNVKITVRGPYNFGPTILLDISKSSNL